MPDEQFYIDAIRELVPTLSFTVKDEDYTTLVSINEVGLPSKADIDAKVVDLKSRWTATQYQRDRKAEYPSLLELTVALYDTSDQTALIAKRASVKLKYPKPA